MSSPTFSLLAGLVKGYTGAQDQAKAEELASRKLSRDSMLQYLGHMASNPNIPAEHQQWALQKAQELAQADITKKLPKVDLAELPPVMRQPPSQQTASNLPQMTLQAPVGPGAGAGPSGGPATPPAASSDVGRASNGTVNALGDVPPIYEFGSRGVIPHGMPIPKPDLTPSPVTLPAQPQGVIQHPVPPQQLSPAGQPHITTEQERAQSAMDTQEEMINRLQQQSPMKSREELAYFAQHGAFPKPEEFTLGPGQKRYGASGQVVAENTEAKPGAKSGYEPVMGPGGPIGVKDVATGGMLSPDEVQKTPAAKAVLDQAVQMHEQQRKERSDDEDKRFAHQQSMESTREAAAINKQVAGAAVDAAKKAKPMVDVLESSEKYMRTGDYTPRQDLALIVRAVRAMNPGTVRLPQRELELELHAGSYGDRFRRWFDTASKGLLPADQRSDLMTVIREETTQTATSAAKNWRQALPNQKMPPYLLPFAVEQPQGPASVPSPSGNLPPGWHL